VRDNKSGHYVVSNSEMQTFKDCRRKWWLGYHRGLEPIQTQAHVARDTGTLTHEALRRYYRDDQNVDAALEYLRAQRAIDLEFGTYSDQTKIHDSHDLAQLIVEGYFEWLIGTGADARLRVEAVETAITIPADIPGVDLTGKIDLQATDGVTGQLLTVDHKTVQGFAATQVILHLNEQAPLYVTLQRRGLPDSPSLTGAMWNMLRKTKRTAKSKPPYYARTTLILTDAQLERFWQQIHGQIVEILRVEDALNNGADHNVVAYPTPSGDCNWKCPFFAVCGLFNDPTYDSEFVLDSNYTVGNPMARYDDTNLEGSVSA
jgi:RecB family exonuclease